MEKKISVCLTFDFDAMSLWIGTFRSKSMSAISRGEFGRVGAERLPAIGNQANIDIGLRYPRLKGPEDDLLPLRRRGRVVERAEQVARRSVEYGAVRREAQRQMSRIGPWLA